MFKRGAKTTTNTSATMAKLQKTVPLPSSNYAKCVDIIKNQTPSASGSVMDTRLFRERKKVKACYTLMFFDAIRQIWDAI